MGPGILGEVWYMIVSLPSYLLSVSNKYVSFNCSYVDSLHLFINLKTETNNKAHTY